MTTTTAARTPEELHALIAAAMNAGDLEAFLALHEPGATTHVPPDGRQVTGLDAIREALEPIFALTPNAAIQVVGKLEGAELAVTHAHWMISGHDGAEPVELSGRGTIVSRRQADGTWRIVIDNPMTPD